MRRAAGWLIAIAVLTIASRGRADDAPGTLQTGNDPAAIEFFEKEVRPLIVARCQKCHGPEKQKGELRLDSREAIVKGGRTGPAVAPGKPEESLLVDAINYGDLFRMPPKSKLSDQEIGTLTKWVAQGAPWPRDAHAQAASAAKAFDLKERAKHWSFQPIQDPAAPEVTHAAWPRTAVDPFILAKLEASGLAPAEDADRRTLLRRVTFDLIGLPPAPAEVAAFLADTAPDAYESAVDRLLASPHYGERWGRHWLDLVRFAETAGHEFDYDIPNAWRYRDYIVRAWNDDLPYDRFVVEHLAGDLLPMPRRHPTDGSNESIVATGFFFLGEGTHSPVDVREDAVARVDNQLDVMAKTFLGLTVACARCHDHKFDAISAQDYYALAGFLRSSRHQQAFLDPPQRIAAKAAALLEIRKAIAASLREGTEPAAALKARVTGQQLREAAKPSGGDEDILFEDFEGSRFEHWYATGDAFGVGPTGVGELTPAFDGAAGLVAVPPGVAHSGTVSARLAGVLRSETFTITKKSIHCLATGQGGRIDVVVDGYEKIRDPIYGRLTRVVNHPQEWRWETLDVGMWLGHSAYLELADGAVVDYGGAVTKVDTGDGFLAVDEIRFSDSGPAAGRLTELNGISQARRLMPDDPDLGPERAQRLREAIDRYRALEAQIPAPTLAPAIADGTGEDLRVHLRGSYKTLGELTPRRFLEAVAGPRPIAPPGGSGRLELARQVVDRSNPFLARVMVNRIWKHHFGQGLVKTCDDFGAMGQPPTHPELLDFLAREFVRRDWSIKAMHRLILQSRAYRMSSRPDPEAEQIDPTNALLHRMNVRRLEAETIRDAVLAVSGRLDPTFCGPGVPPHLTPFMEGRGRPGRSGPLDGDGRRSLYLNVRRNFLTPMLLAFDYPVPFSTMGRRNVSNVPAQALTLMNDPFIISQARLWAERARAGANDPTSIVARLYEEAFSRPPTAGEVAQALAFLAEQGRAYGEPAGPRAWADLCHVLLNVKELVFVN